MVDWPKIPSKLRLPERLLETQEIDDLVDDVRASLLKKNCKVVSVIGVSGSGKDTFVEALQEKYPNSIHVRFGDVMKDMAYDLGMVPFDREYYEDTREERHIILPNGKTALDAWIALDVIREYNPYVFIEKSLDDLLVALSNDPFDIPLVIFSGMRTEAGLKVSFGLSDVSYRIERNHTPPDNATLDALQVQWPVGRVIKNYGTVEELKEMAFNSLLKDV